MRLRISPFDSSRNVCVTKVVAGFFRLGSLFVLWAIQLSFVCSEAILQLFFQALNVFPTGDSLSYEVPRLLMAARYASCFLPGRYTSVRQIRGRCGGIFVLVLKSETPQNPRETDGLQRGIYKVGITIGTEMTRSANQK